VKRKTLRKDVSQQVASLTDMGLAELRAQWEERYGAPPKHRAPDLLRRVLAWRIQADALGGLDAATIRLLGNEKAPLMVAEQPGTRLAREYAGRRHEVVVVEDGVVYEGDRYGSLSEVARIITGQRWNGPRFFGLRRENVR
jgi:Protein of unknown function (DUF2924)